MNQKNEKLHGRAWSGLFFLELAMAACLFIPAGTIAYWQAWIFLAVFGAAVLLITLYLMKYDPALLERRMNAGPAAEKEKSQKIIQFITSIGFLALLVIPALDYKYQWLPQIPFALVLLGDLLVALGFYIIFIVFKENTFTSATIEIHKDQKVISTGLYAYVRHPMYMGALIMLIGIVLALGSWWGFLVLAFTMPALIWRIFDEEALLLKKLKGYPEYTKKVKHRLIPYIW